MDRAEHPTAPGAVPLGLLRALKGLGFRVLGWLLGGSGCVCVCLFMCYRCFCFVFLGGGGWGLRALERIFGFRV